MIEKIQALIAEDDDEDFELFSLALKEIEISVMLMRAENGDILLKILNRQIPDILFLDVLMPCKDGKQCLREIRANKKFDLLPVIIYSSLKDARTVEFCFREGANIYVIKPSSYTELKEVLKRIFAIEWERSLYYPALPNFVVNSASST